MGEEMDSHVEHVERAIGAATMSMTTVSISSDPFSP